MTDRTPEPQTADLIPFPRLRGDNLLRNAQDEADLIASHVDFVNAFRSRRRDCANGMPGHPPCRSPAELEAMLRAQSDTTAARESV